jgi:hypothetical protein
VVERSDTIGKTAEKDTSRSDASPSFRRLGWAHGDVWRPVNLQRALRFLPPEESQGSIAALPCNIDVAGLTASGKRQAASGKRQAASGKRHAEESTKPSSPKPPPER